MKVSYYVGELYNRSAFGSNNDRDAILKAFEQYAFDCFSKFRGAFALALEDDEKIILVRDQFGIIPYYYYAGNGRLYYADSVGSLLDQGVPRKLSKKGLAAYMAYGGVQHPLSMIEGVVCVPPSSYLVYDKRSHVIKATRYWLPRFEIRNWNQAELNEAISSALFESVKSQVEYGGNPAAYLSGGTDSSAIAIMMRRMGADQDVRTYCVHNEDPAMDERYWAQLVADRNHTNHKVLELSDAFVRDHLEEAVSCFDQPSLDGVNFWMGCKLVKDQGENVIFSGEGGDELFLGFSQIYKPWYACKYDKYFSWMPRWFGSMVERMAPSEKFRKLAQLMGRNVDPFYIAWRIFSEDRIKSVVKPELVDFSGIRNPEDDMDGRRSELDLFNYLSWMDFRNVEIDLYLRDGYQTSVPHNLMVRTPILNVDLVEILYSIPGKEKFNPKLLKPHLVAACGDDLPKECVFRPKKVFSIPFDRYFKGSIKDKIEAFLKDGDTILFRPEKITELGRQYYAGKVYWSNVWMLFMAEAWARRNKVEV